MKTWRGPDVWKNDGKWMLKLLSLCLFDDQMLPMVSDHGCVSEGGTEKHQNCVSHFQNLVEAQWNGVKNKYTVAWHSMRNLQQPDITRYSSDSLINALAMGQLVAYKCLSQRCTFSVQLLDIFFHAIFDGTLVFDPLYFHSVDLRFTTCKNFHHLPPCWGHQCLLDAGI